MIFVLFRVILYLPSLVLLLAYSIFITLFEYILEIMHAIMFVIAVLMLFQCYCHYCDNIASPSDYFGYLYTSIIRWAATEYPLRSETLRGRFTDMNMIRKKIASGHSHGTSAADRIGATQFIDLYASTIGRVAYYVQQSLADIRRGRVGSRVYFWVKDLTANPGLFLPSDLNVIAMVDLDQYIDMPFFLTRHFLPVLLYTFQPEQVSRVASDYSFTFDANSTVDYQVADGRYRHQVWNWSKDHLLAVRKFFGIPYKATAYLVDRRKTMTDHELVLLTPVAAWDGVFAILATWLESETLERLVVAHGDYLRLKAHVAPLTFEVPKNHLPKDDLGAPGVELEPLSKQVMMSTGRVGMYSHATVSIEIDEAVCLMAKNGKHNITLTQVRSFVKDRCKAAILHDFHLSRVSVKPDTVIPLQDSINRYQFADAEYDPDAKQTMVAFMSPLIPDCYTPDNCLANEINCIVERVLKVQKKVQMSDKFLRFSEEFLEILIPIPHLHDPVEPEEVRLRQHRPSQVHIIESNDGLDARPKVKAFEKQEAGQGCKPARLISTIDGVTKMEYSRFIYSFSDFLKDQSATEDFRWYAFGKTPAEIAEDVAYVASSASKLYGSDFDKMDGRLSELVRTFETLLMMRFFKVEYAEVISKLMLDQYVVKGFGRHGCRYEAGFSRRSGGPATSAFNTLLNKFTNFCAFRMTKVDGAFISPAEAWCRKGSYGGDDGITADIDPAKLVEAAAAMGQIAKIDIWTRGEAGVQFLSRIYSPYVWFGDLNSCCDIPRACSKFHVTVALPENVSPLEKLIEKARSMILSDRNTPIIGPLLQLIERLCDEQGIKMEMTDKTFLVRAWNSVYPPDLHYYNDYGEWMMDYVVTVLPDYDFTSLLSYIMKVTKFKDILVMPTFISPKETDEMIEKSKIYSENGLVVNGDVIHESKGVDWGAGWRRKLYIPYDQIFGYGVKRSNPKPAKPKADTHKSNNNTSDRKGRWKRQKQQPPARREQGHRKQQLQSPALRRISLNAKDLLKETKGKEKE